jgi:hypothetical protein
MRHVGTKYLVIRAYYPKYDIQGAPSIIPWSSVIKKQNEFRRGISEESGFEWAKRRAREELVRHDVKPLGKIHPSHRAIINDVVIQSMQIRQLDRDQLYHMKSMRTRHGLRVRRKVPRKRRRKRVSRIARLR